MKTPEQYKEQLHKICDELECRFWAKYELDILCPEADIISNRLQKCLNKWYEINGFLTIEQAKEALEKGHKITHATFSPRNEVYVFKKGKFTYWNKKRSFKIVFDNAFDDEIYNHLWLIIPEYEQQPNT